MPRSGSSVLTGALMRQRRWHYPHTSCRRQLQAARVSSRSPLDCVRAGRADAHHCHHHPHAHQHPKRWSRRSWMEVSSWHNGGGTVRRRAHNDARSLQSRRQLHHQIRRSARL